MNYKPTVEVDGKFEVNGLVFATEEEAKASAKDLFGRWTLTTDYGTRETEDPVNTVIDMKTMKQSSVEKVA